MDDFDDYLEYKMFEDSMKRDKLNAYIKKANRPDSKYPPLRTEKKNSDLGCGGWLVFIFIVIAAIYVFGSCDSSKSDSDLSGRGSHSSSYGSSRSNTSNYGSRSSSHLSDSKTYSGSTNKPSYGSGSKSKSRSDPYDAKSYSHPDDFYYNYYDDFWDYEDAEDYWDEHQND